MALNDRDSKEANAAKLRVQQILEARTAKLADTEERRQKRLASGVKAPTKFTTQYAVDWGRSKGWKLVDRENFDYRLNRHHDLQLGADAMFDDGDGLVLVQGAGQYERSSHRARFEGLGGVEKAKRRHMKFYYVEFIRGNKTPIILEQWV